MKRSFNYTFEDQSTDSTLTFECSEGEHFKVIVEDDVAVLYATKNALATLTRIFAKLALSDYKDGFHVHLEENFDTDKPEALRVIIDEEL